MNWSLQKILTRKMVEEGARRSKGYGFAWRDFDTACIVTYPIPLNVLLRELLRFKTWLCLIPWVNRFS